jgi:hypothetical protein
MNLRKILIITVIISILTTSFIPAFGSTNPTREELEAMIEEVAVRRGIPSVILKAIARTESVFKHYNDDGSVKIGVSGSIGLMQIHNSRGTFDGSRLKTDIYYNIEAGAEILLEKWEMSASGKIPKVGNMDPNILESWYMPLWAYNSYVESNNPNMIPYYFSTWVKHYAYQDLVLYKVIPEEYNQQVSMIDTSYLPESGLPDKNIKIPYPEETHEGDVALFEEGDKVAVKTRSSLNIRKEPNGEIVGKAENGDEYYIVDEPELSGGYYWHNLADEDGKVLGWAARNWLIILEKNQELPETNENKEENETNDIELKEVKFNDINNHWAKEYIEDLYQKDIVKGKSETAFKPDDEITKQEFYTMVYRVINLENNENEFDVKDMDEISNYALEPAYMLYKNNIIETDEEGYLLPKSCITRKEVVEALGNIVKCDQDYKELHFEDIEDLSNKELEGLMKIYTIGLIKGRDENTFAPEDLITRGELSKLLSMVYDVELLYEMKQ